MSELPPNDTSLKELEARLHALRPSIGEEERLRLLYECAFAAGKRSAHSIVRIWQMIGSAGVLGCLFVGLQWGPPGNPKPVAPAMAPAPVPAEKPINPENPSTEPTAPSPATTIVPTEIASAFKSPPRINLDAWQLSEEEEMRLSQSLRKYEELSLTDRSQTVIGLQSAILGSNSH